MKTNVTFGRAVKMLRGRRTGVAIARAALGPRATSSQCRDFANYLSKIEHDQVPNVGLPRLRLIARGLGFEHLSTFFSAVETLGVPDRLK